MSPIVTQIITAPLLNASQPTSGQISSSASHEASGSSLLWAMLSLALCAMTQSTIVWRGSDGPLGGAFSPQRSSPSACLVDGVVESVLLLRAGFRWWRGIPPQAHVEEGGESTDGTTWRSKTGSLVITLAAFALGVLPQAIKIFTTRGILVTQLHAAIYLFSAATKGLTFLAREKYGYVKDTTLTNLRPRPEGQTRNPPQDYLAGLLHVIWYLWVWEVIGRSIVLRVVFHESFMNICHWLRLTGLAPFFVIALVYDVGAAVFPSHASRSWLQLLTIICWPFMCLLHYVGFMRESASSWDRWSRGTVVLMLVACLCCYVLACLASVCADWAVGAPRDEIQESTPRHDHNRTQLFMGYYRDASSKIDGSFPLGDNDTSGNYCKFRLLGTHLWLSMSRIFVQAFLAAGLLAAYIVTVYLTLVSPLEVWNSIARNGPKVKPQVHWIAHVAFNLTTAVLYYLVAFDGTDTLSPTWTSILG